MKMRNHVGLLLVILAFCGIVQAAIPDTVVIVTATGAFTLNEFDLNGSGQTSYVGFDERTCYAAAGISVNGDVVCAFDDGSALVSKYNALDAPVSDGVVGAGSPLLGATFRPNGSLVFGSIDGWVYARSNNDVTAAPAGYTGAANLLLGTASAMYMDVRASSKDEVLIAGNDLGVMYLRKGSDLSATPAGYQWDGLTMGTTVFATATLSSGDVVISSRAGNPSYHMFVRDNADLSVAPAGYVGDGTVLGNGSRTKAIAVASGDYLVVGNDSGELFVRKASDLTDDTLDGFTSTYSADMAAYNGILSLAVTSNNNVIIALYDGRIVVRSLFDIDGADVIPMTGRYTMSGGIVGIYTVPEPMTLSLLIIGGLAGLRRRR